MKLYYAPGACSLAVHIVAREAGIPLDLVRVDLVKHRTEAGVDLAAINPKNSVPAIELEDGQILTEAAALVQWLAGKAPEAGLMPAAGTMDRFRVQEWLNFIATELHKGFGPLWHRDTPEATREGAIARLHSRFALVEERLGESDYLAGDGFSIVDVYAFTIISWTNLLKVDLGPYPRIRAFLDRIAARPAVRQAMTAEGLIRKAA